MNNFLTWENLTTYTTFVAIVYMIVEFTKELKGIQKIPTKQWSFLVSFVLLVLVHIANRTFHIIDLVLYALTAISISLGSNGLSDYNKKVEEKKNSNQV